MRTDILLVHPLFISKDPVEQRLMTPYFPLGLMYLAAVLRERGYNVSIFDGTFRQHEDEFEEAMRELRPKVVGITALMTTKPMALRLAEIAHGHGATVVMGGPDPTARSEEYLRHTANGKPVVDMVVWDEGELTLAELMDHLFQRGDHKRRLAQIEGLRYLDDNGQMVSTPHRPLIADLDSIPFPARDLVDMEAYRQAWLKHHGYFSLSIINTRGCPYGCAWCQKSIFGRTYRSRSPENVAAEMKLIKETYAPDHLRVVDDITGVNRKWISRWHDEVLKREAVIPFECLSRVNLMDMPTLTLLKEIGCRTIFFGAESGSQKVLDAMKKGAKVEQIYRVAEACRQVGIKVYFFMMVGYPTEEWKDIQLSIQLLRDTVPDQFSTTIAYPLPGTEFYEQVRDRLTFDSDWDYSAENRLLYQRGKYNTRFYRWVIRLFRKEWEHARLQKGMVHPSFPLRLRTYAGLWLSRGVVRALEVLTGRGQEPPLLRPAIMPLASEHHPARSCRL